MSCAVTPLQETMLSLKECRRRMQSREVSQSPETQQFSLNQSKLYQEFLAEREEILRYKWIESERLGHDIGYERALLDWIRYHRDRWREERRIRVPASRK